MIGKMCTLIQTVYFNCCLYKDKHTCLWSELATINNKHFNLRTRYLSSAQLLELVISR